MKALWVGLFVWLMLGCQSTGSIENADGYRYIQGKPWRGVNVAGQPLRQSNDLCFESWCYRLNRPVNLPVALQRRYQIDDLDFEVLARAPGVSRRGDVLALPDDLGRFLFNEARLRYLRSMREERRPWLLP